MPSIFRPGLFENRVALVTGGGSGIGFSIARILGELGAKVAIASRKQERIDAAKVELADKHGVKALATTCDIREVEQVDKLVEKVRNELGEIDVLVNNAGGQFPTSAESLSTKGWDAVIRNNLSGTFYMTQAVGTRSMIPRKKGRIVNIIANIARGFPGMIHTGAARAGVENMTKTLAIEWAQYDIQVNAVAPGVIQSSGMDHYPPELIEMSRARTPKKRLGTVDEVGELVCFLASDAGSFVTGETWYIDGGAHLWGDNWIIPEHESHAPPGDTR